MPIDTSGDNTSKRSGAGPLAVADLASGAEGAVLLVDVMANDLGGSAKWLWSVNQQEPAVPTPLDTLVTLPSGANISLQNGMVQYDPGTNFDYLPAGQIALDSFTYSIRVANGTLGRANVTITLRGENDPATIGGAITGQLREDTDLDSAGAVVAQGLLTISDIDSGEAQFQAATGTSTNGFGTFTIDDAGHWTYAATNSHSAIQSLSDGQSLVDHFTVTAADGTPQRIDITITGQDEHGTLRAVFNASDFAYGSQIWGYDGENIFRLTEFGAGSSTKTAFGGEFYALTSQAANSIIVSRIAADGTTWRLAEIATEHASTQGFVGEHYGSLYFAVRDYVTDVNSLYKLDGNGDVVHVTDLGLINWSFIEFAGSTYFVEYDEAHGWELRKLDADGNDSLVADISPGGSSSSPSKFIEYNGALYFAATDPVHGNELRKLDQDGTVTLVSDINPGSSGSSLAGLTEFNGALYFSAFDPANGTELRKLDANGAVTTFSLVPGGNSSLPAELTEFNGALYFRAYNQAQGGELFKLNASDVISLVADINPGANHSLPYGFFEFDNALYFGAYDRVNQSALRRLNADGTVTRIANMIPYLANPVLGDGNPAPVIAGGSLYFAGWESNIGSQLFRIDASGAYSAIDISSDWASPRELTVAGDEVLFEAAQASGRYLFSHDGETLASPNPYPNGAGAFASEVVEFNGRTFFESGPPATGYELFAIDEDGTVTTYDIRSGASSSNPSKFTVFEGSLYFRAIDSANGSELRRIDATGALSTYDIAPGSASSSPDDFTAFAGALYFTATDPTFGDELRKLDADGAITTFDLDPGFSGSGAEIVGTFGNGLYLRIRGSNGYELDRIDADGTFSLVAQVDPGSFFEFNNAVYFNGSDHADAYALRKIDANGTFSTINEIPGEGYYPSSFIGFDGSLYFIAYSPVYGHELFAVDGNDTVTLVADINPGTQGSLDYADLGKAIVFNDVLYFSAYDSSAGVELRSLDSDGNLTTHDLSPGVDDSSPMDFTRFGVAVYFVATDPINGRELRKIDGAGSLSIIDINPGSGHSSPDGFTEFQGSLYFTAYDAEHGSELRRLDGDGTLTVLEIVPGTLGVSAVIVGLANDTLYLRATTLEHGQELYSFDGTSFWLHEVNFEPMSLNPTGIVAIA